MAHYRIGDELYDGDPTTWMNVDVSSVQRALGCSLSKFMDRLGEMDVDAIQAFIWVLRRRNESGLRIDDVTFTIRDYVNAVEMTDADVRDAWPAIVADPGVEDAAKSLAENRALFLSALEAEQVARLFVDGDLVREAAPLALADQTATGT